MTKETTKKKRKDNLKRLLFGGIIAVFLLWLIIPVGAILFFGKPNSAGEFGDTFGIINALFSSLAFALLIYTSFMQREELELQRKELKLTRKELELTRVELEKSAEAQSTLVALTREELEMQKEVRKSQIKPELKLDGVRWVQTSGGHLLELKLKTKYHKLKFSKVEIAIGHSDLKLDNPHLIKVINKYFEESSDIFVVLSTGTKSPTQPEGLKIKVEFMDIDSNLYRQFIQFEKDNQFITNVQGVSIAELLS
jgi:hypothetical protein